MSQELAQKSLLGGRHRPAPHGHSTLASVSNFPTRSAPSPHCSMTCSLRGVYARSVSSSTSNIVAAILTIIGYSVNDTIVVFDRIRENVKAARGRSYREIANEAINLSLGRTILTTSVTM